MAWERPILEHGVPTKWLWVVWYPGGLALGEMTDIGAYTFIQAKHGVVIEDEVQIGSHCAIYSVSTIDDKSGPVRIRRGARIGSHSVIMPGVEIGEGAVVGACSFVNRDVPAYATVYGTPARVAVHQGPRGGGVTMTEIQRALVKFLVREGCAPKICVTCGHRVKRMRWNRSRWECELRGGVHVSAEDSCDEWLLSEAGELL